MHSGGPKQRGGIFPYRPVRILPPPYRYLERQEHHVIAADSVRTPAKPETDARGDLTRTPARGLIGVWAATDAAPPAARIAGKETEP